jgi:hypothetical protein
MATATTSVLTSATLEDWLLFLVPLVTTAAGLNWSGLVPGLPGFLIGVIVGALAKALVGIAQSPTKNYEDYLLFFITLAGALAAGLENNASLAVYGTVIGLIAKALPSLVQGINVEDVLMLVSVFFAGIAQYAGNMQIAAFALLVGVLAKSIPSLGTNGTAGLPTASTTSAPATPAATKA